jgi:hypothetical protein
MISIGQLEAVLAQQPEAKTMCELRREIVEMIQRCVRLESEPIPDSGPDAPLTWIKLVLIDPDTAKKTVLGEPIVVSMA